MLCEFEERGAFDEYLEIITIMKYIVQTTESIQTDIGRVVEILQVQLSDRVNEKQTLLVVRKFYTGGQHARLKMPTIHATEEDVFLLAGIEVRSFLGHWFICLLPIVFVACSINIKCTARLRKGTMYNGGRNIGITRTRKHEEIHAYRETLKRSPFRCQHAHYASATYDTSFVPT